MRCGSIFVDYIMYKETLGRGSYGEVRKAKNRLTK